MMQLARLSVVAVAVLLASANAGKHSAQKTIVDTALATGKHTVLAAALTKANLIATLNGTGPFTVFAPTDTAFAAALVALKMNQTQLLANAALKSILTYHVVSGTVKSASLTNGMKTPSLQGENLTVTIANTTVKVNAATVTTADVTCSNGVIHIIDQVLVPPTVMAAITAAATKAAAAAKAATTTAAPAAATTTAAKAAGAKTPAAGATTTVAAAASSVSMANPAKVFWALVVSATISTFVLA